MTCRKCLQDKQEKRNSISEGQKKRKTIYVWVRRKEEQYICEDCEGHTGRYVDADNGYFTLNHSLNDRRILRSYRTLEAEPEQGIYDGTVRG